MPEIQTLIFDLGGVLLELRGQPIRNEWTATAHDAEASWHQWLHSPSAKAFEAGLCSEDDFAEGIVREFSLSISPENFKHEFRAWPVGLYDGVLELLDSLRSTYQLAVLSNSNELHWPRKMGEMQLDGRFDFYFGSHLMGLVKPDPRLFAAVIEKIGGDPAGMLFLDDNQLNVDGAVSAGLTAARVQGFDDVLKCLSRYDVLA
ncbi:MAG: HAD family hydrolase [Granulosicoccus sp.]